MASQHYCLRWNNYQTNMTSVFHQLLQNEAFVDVTLACNDLSLKAHKVVLSACSSYFQKLLLENPCKHPTIIMPQDVCYEDLKFIIEFVYKGEIDVSQDELQSLLKTADQLKIKGLCEVPDERDDSNNLDLPFISRRKYPKLRRISPTNKNKLLENNHRKQTYRDPAKSNIANEDDEEEQLVVEVEDVLTRNICGSGGGPCEDIEGDSVGCSSSVNVGNSSDEDNDMPVVAGKVVSSKRRANRQANMSSHGLIGGLCVDEFPPEPPAPSATPVEPIELQECSPTRTLLTNTSSHRTDLSDGSIGTDAIKIKFETLRSLDQGETLDIDEHMQKHEHSMESQDDDDHSMHSMMITPEFMGMGPGSSGHLDMNNEIGGSLKTNGHSDHRTHSGGGGGPKTWTQEDMELALDALRNHNMSLTKASATYGIPSTTLWQRAHRLGIDTPKKEGPTKSWTEENLNSALEALRTGTISANKASKAYGIPSSTLYKIARREGIRLAAPFNAAPTTWSPEDLERALESIRSGQTSVQRASTEFGIPTGTLYGRCKREGIELSRSNPTPWSEDAMGEALEAVRIGQMSINQAAIHYNLPYSSLYGRFKRGKYETEQSDSVDVHGGDSQVLSQYHNHNMQYQHQTNS